MRFWTACSGPGSSQVAEGRSRSGARPRLDVAFTERLAEAITPPYGLLVRFAAPTGLRAGDSWWRCGSSAGSAAG